MRSSAAAIAACLLFALGPKGFTENHWPVPPEKGMPLPEPTMNVEAMTLDELFREAQQYAMTAEARSNKYAAKKKFFSFGPEALSYLIRQLDIENLWLRVYAYELARSMPSEQAVPTLIKHLDMSQPRQTRYVLHILGFFEAPDSPPDLSAYFGHEKTEGPAIRLAGKWKQSQYLERILPYLDHKKERHRIMAVNALRDVGIEETRPHLEAALKDEFFTVRKCAQRALSALNP